MGTVISVDQQKGLFIIQPQANHPANNKDQTVATDKGHITVQLPRKYRIKNHKNRLPRCLAPGRQVRLRGQSDTESNLFFANDIRGCGLGGGPDPTGIRGRLGKACNKGRMHKRFRKRYSPARHVDETETVKSQGTDGSFE